jgi:hypothetical protein
MAQCLSKHAEIAQQPLRRSIGRIGQNLEAGTGGIAPGFRLRQFTGVGHDELWQLDHGIGWAGHFLRIKRRAKHKER